MFLNSTLYKLKIFPTIDNKNIRVIVSSYGIDLG